MSFGKKTHITQFRWKSPCEGNSCSRDRWKALLVSGKRNGVEIPDEASVESSWSRTRSGYRNGLPGRFPGATAYFAVPGSVFRWRHRCRNVKSVCVQTEANLAQYFIRSSG
jgi:hypothetical protein